MDLDENTKKVILDFVDTNVPRGGEYVWLAGSRVRGDARPNSDWDVIAFFRDYPIDSVPLFASNQKSTFLVEGGIIELVLAHPQHWNDPSPYMTELWASGVRLR